MLGLPAQVVILSEAKDLTDARNISIADRRIAPDAGRSTKDPPTPGKLTCGLPARPSPALLHRWPSFSALSVASHGNPHQRGRSVHKQPSFYK